MFAKINKSGCGEYHGNVKVRVDFFLEKDDPRYSDTLVDVLNEEGEPIGKKLNPFHSHFVYLYPDFTDLDVYRLTEFHAPNFYLAFQNEWDKVLGGMRHGWDVRERVRPVRLDNEKDYQKIKRECERKITLLGELSLSASGEGREFPSTDIDIGDGAADLSSFRVNGSTHVTLGNPANETGTLDTVEIWAQSDMSGTKVGTFSGSGTNYTNRDYESIGDVTSGAKRTFTGLDIDVSSGDFIGAYWTGGRLEYSGAGGSGVYNKYGDQFGAGTQTFDLLDSDAVLALYGTGETGSNNYPVNISCGLTVGASVSYVAGYKRNTSSGLTVSPSVTGIRGRNESCSTNLSLSPSVTFTEGKGVVITTGLGLCVNDRNNYLITIPSTVTKDVVDFPFVITENNIPSSFWSVAETDNLILRDVTGSLLYGELVTLDTVNHKLELYVKIPYAFEGISRSFYLSVGEGASLVGLTGTANAQSVWDENFVFVSHMNDNPLDSTQILDSTSNGNHGTKGAGYAPTEVDGLIGKAQSFDGAQLINLGNSSDFDFTNSFTSEVICNVDNKTDLATLVNKVSAWFHMARGLSSKYASYLYGCTPPGYHYGGGFSLDNWQYSSIRYNGTNVIHNTDGTEYTTAVTGNITVNTRDVYIGYRFGGTYNYDGLISETRISNKARGAGWISFTSSNLKENSTSYSVTETSQTSPSRQVNYSRDSLTNLSLTSIVTRTVNYAVRMAITNLSLNPIVTRTVNYTRSATTNLSFQAIVTAIKRGWVKVKLKLFKRSVNMYMNNRSVKVKLHKRDIKLKIRRK